jgi:hypothetical protein
VYPIGFTWNSSGGSKPNSTPQTPSSGVETLHNPSALCQRLLLCTAVCLSGGVPGTYEDSCLLSSNTVHISCSACRKGDALPPPEQRTPPPPFSLAACKMRRDPLPMATAFEATALYGSGRRSSGRSGHAQGLQTDRRQHQHSQWAAQASGGAARLTATQVALVACTTADAGGMRCEAFGYCLNPETLRVGLNRPHRRRRHEEVALRRYAERRDRRLVALEVPQEAVVVERQVAQRVVATLGGVQTDRLREATGSAERGRHRERQSDR